MPWGAPDHPGASPARPRAAGALGAFAGGLALAHHAAWLSSPAWFSLAAIGAAAALLARGRAATVALALAMVALGAGWMTVRVHEVPRSSLVRLVPADGDSLVRVEGVLERDAELVEAPAGPLVVPMGSEDTVRLDLRVWRAQTDAGWTRASGRVVVRVPGADAERYTGGLALRATGRLRPPAPPANPGEPDWVGLARQRGVAGTLFVPTPELVEPGGAHGALERARAWWLARRGDLRRRATRALGLDPASRGESLVGALVLGQRPPELDRVQRSFRRAGVAHLMAISGFHLAVLAGVALFVSRMTGERGWVEPAIVAALVLIYVLVLPARPPIVRAAAMVIALLGADAAGRRYDRLAVLAWVTIGLLVWRPLDVYQLGLQLTVGITGLLLWAGDRSGRRALERAIAGRRTRWWRPITSTAWVCVACWVVAAPAIAHHAGVISPIAPLAATLAIVPVLATLELGYLAVALGLVLGGSTWATTLAGVVGGWTVALVAWLDAVPGGSFRVGPVSAAWTIGATALALSFVARPRWRDGRLWVAALALGVWLVAGQLVGARPPRDVALRIDTLSVGNGACHLVRAGPEAVLWDCGSMRPGVGEDAIPEALRELGRVRVRTAVVSHPNLDHFNALPDVAGAIGLERLIVTEHFLRAAERRGSGESVALERLRALGVRVETVHAGDVFEVGPAGVEVLWPPAPGEGPARGVLAANDTSIVARVTVQTRDGPRRALFTGDVQGPAIAGLLASGEPVGADVLELPHHGSARPEAVAFAGAVDPRVVVQSTGPSRVGLGVWDALRAGRDWRCTATDGAVWVELRRDGSVASGSVRER